MMAGRRANEERYQQMVDMWNKPPYPSMGEIGKTFGVTRQRVRQILARAAAVWNLPIISLDERSFERQKLGLQEEMSSRPKCRECGISIKRNTKHGYCTAHYLQSPEFKEYHRKHSNGRYHAMKNELETLRKRVAELEARAGGETA